MSRYDEPSEYEQLCWQLEARKAERQWTLMEIEGQIGPRPSVASVLRKLRLRRGRR